jgi:hypothetical protein
MSLTSLTTTAAETTASQGGVNHWVVGAVVLAILLVLMLALLAFGAGRDHS